MKHNSESITKRVIYTSKRLFLLFLQIFFLAGIIGVASQILELNWKWLKIVEFCFLALSVVLLVISWMTPGVLVIFGVPWLAYAWLLGIKNKTIQNNSWENLSNIQKFLIYLWSLFLFGFMLLAIVGFMVQAFGK